MLGLKLRVCQMQERTARNLVSWVLLIVLALAGGVGTQPAAAQGRATPGEEAEFLAAVERWRSTDDSEVEIEALQHVLALEPKLQRWPLKKERRVWKAEIFGALGDSYWNRRLGFRSENLEAARTAYLTALTLASREAMPEQWAQIQHDLGDVLSERIAGSRTENQEAAIAAYNAALAARNRDTAPEAWASTQRRLAKVYEGRLLGSRAENLEAAIAANTGALSVLTRERQPSDWAQAQHHLASLYMDRIVGSRAENLEKAIEGLEAALTVRTKEAMLQEWVSTQNGLGNAYRERIIGARRTNLETSRRAFEAALGAMVKDTDPRTWAILQHNLARTIEDRIDGVRSQNLESAIKAYEAALTVLPRDREPLLWAQVLDSMARSYRLRAQGFKAENFEEALKAIQSALTVLTREGHPVEWAQTQNSLGATLLERVRGSRTDNIEAAIAAFERALTVRTREDMPLDWARSQHGRAIAYFLRTRGSRADNLETALGAYKAALTVRTREALPGEHANSQNGIGEVYRLRERGAKSSNQETALHAFTASIAAGTQAGDLRAVANAQHNLANLYLDRLAGDKAENIDLAIRFYEAALAERTRENSPSDWAATMTDLGQALVERMRGSRGENLARAVEYYQAALTIRTIDTAPRETLTSARLLGSALLAQGNALAAAAAYADARKAFLLAFGMGLEETEARAVLDEAGMMFSEAAFAAIENGDLAGALEILNEGRARLLAGSLSREAVTLGPEKRARMSRITETLRAARRAADATPQQTGAWTRVAELTKELGDVIGEAARDGPTAIEKAEAVVSQGGALAIPFVTRHGGRILIYSAHDGRLSVAAAPMLTVQSVVEIYGGPDFPNQMRGWLGSYEIQLGSREEIEQRIPEWHRAVESIGEALWQLVGGPLVTALDAAGVKQGAQLVLMPAGHISLLPLALSQATPDAPRLMDNYVLSMAPSLDVLVAAKARAAASDPPSLAAIANPTGDLPFTETETALVSAYFPAAARVSLDKSNAEPEQVLMALQGKNYWHFASHGTFDWVDGTKSSLVMKDSKPLTVQRIIEEQGRLKRPRLVVLSACETGLFTVSRNPDEFLGLPAAFLQIGAGGVLGTLWQVDDMATAFLVSRFYELHLGQGLAPPAALKSAQVWLRSATIADLLAYARAAGARAQLSPDQIESLAVTLITGNRGRAQPRFIASWNAVQKIVRASSEKAGHTSGEDVRRKTRPFEHPVFWGAFTYTGL